MKKKILLCGATHGSNFGDSLFAHLFKEKIKEEYKDIDIIFTKTSSYSKKVLGLEKAKFKDLGNIDAMVYISGGYFGQSHNETFKQSVKRFLNYFVYGVIMVLRRKPISIIGVGAGPLDRKFLRNIAVFLFNKAQVVSVRDVESRKYMLDYGVENEIITTSDSAQVIDEEFLNSSNNPFIDSDIQKLKGKHNVLIHVPSTPINEFKEIVLEAIKESLFIKEDIGFILSHDGVIENNYIKDIYNMFPKNRTVLYNFHDPIEFLEVISSIDSVITTKLHVGILGASFNKGIISFPLHPGKTKRYYNQIGYPDCSKSLFELSKEEAIQMIEKHLYSKVILSEEVRNDALKNFQLLSKFLNDNVNK